MDQLDDELISVIATKKQSTIEIESALAILGIDCPEKIIRRLNVLRRKGVIKGEVSNVVGGWVWWKETDSEMTL